MPLSPPSPPPSSCAPWLPPPSTFNSNSTSSSASTSASSTPSSSPSSSRQVSDTDPLSSLMTASSLEPASVSSVKSKSRSPRKPVPPGPIAPLNITRAFPAPPQVAIQEQPPSSSYINELVARVDAKTNSTYSGYSPQTKRECLTRYTFPAVPEPSRPPPPLEGPDVTLALDQLYARSKRDSLRNGGAPTHIRVQYHSGLHDLLFNTVKRVARKPEYAAPMSTDEERLVEWYTMSVSEWRARCADAHASRLKSTINETVACNDGFTHLVEPINDFLSDKFNFEPGKRPMFTTGWVWPSAKEASGLTDWVAYSSDTPQAILKWKQDVTDSDMLAVSQAAIGPVTSWPLDLYPGFSIWLDGDKVVNDGNITGNGVTACLLAWSDSHHYATRWTVIFNGRTAMVFFLAKPDQLLVSELVLHDAGLCNEDVTMAVVMFALCVLDPSERPTVTMSDQALRFYPRPPARHHKRLPPIPADSEEDLPEGTDWALRIPKRKQ